MAPGFADTVLSSPRSWILYIKKPQSPNKNRMASNIEKCKSLKTNHSNIDEPNNSGTSSLMISRSIFSVRTAMADVPKTNRMFVMLEPTTLPTTISEEPLNTESMDVVSSGREVPNDTSVTPMIKGLIPKDKPIRSALSINLLEPMIKVAKLIMKIPS